MNHFVFITPMYNASKTLEQMLYSVLGQRHKDWKLILVDDCSNIEEQEVCRKILSKLEDERINPIWNSDSRGKQWEMSNVLYGIKQCKDNDIICRLDADDYLTDLDALAIIDQVYNQTQCEILWTNHRWSLSPKNISAPLPVDANPYKFPWVSSHFKTFRKYLINNIPYNNFLNQNNELCKRTGDQYLYLPLLYKTIKRVHLNLVTYSYTIKDIPETYQTDDAKFQKEEAEFLRSRGYISNGKAWEEIIK